MGFLQKDRQAGQTSFWGDLSCLPAHCDPNARRNPARVDKTAVPSGRSTPHAEILKCTAISKPHGKADFYAENTENS